MCKFKRGKMRKLHLLIFLAFSLLMISFVSAGFFSDLFGKITGYAPTGDTNVTITVSGDSPVVIVVDNSTIDGVTTTPTANGFIDIEFFVNVSDPDGVADINDSSVNATFMFFDSASFTEATRSNNSCVLVADLGAKDANFSCTIRMYYFDGNGIWNITVRADDLGGGAAQVNDSKNFTLDELKAIQISPTGITFSSVSPGETNITSNNDPTIINNTGNFNVSAGGIEITATTLIGVSVPADNISVSNFSISNVDSTGPPANESCIGQTTPVNATSTSIASSFVGRGNNSLSNNDATSGQEQIYYCITQVPPDISSQTYSSAASDNGYGAWTITMV